MQLPDLQATGSMIDGLDAVAANIGDVRDPYPQYAEARRTEPVARVSHFGTSVTMCYRYAEAERVLGDGETFSNRINGRWMRPFLGRTILEMDGHEHITHRRLISHAFRPRALMDWERTLVEPAAHELIDRFASRGRAELVRDLAWQLPVGVMARLVGVPSVDHAMWQRRAIELERTAVDPAAAIAASAALKGYFEPLVEQRRRRPAADLISDLVTAEIDGQRLDDELIHSFLRLLVPAGAGTTYRLVGTLLFALLTHPEQLERLRADRSLVPRAIEEALRWEAPVQSTPTCSTSNETPPGISPSPTGPTTAWGRTWRDWRPGSPWRPSSTGCPTCGSTPAGTIPTSSGSPSGRPRPCP